MKAKLGIAPIAWSNDDLPELGGETTLETCLNESKLAGFSAAGVICEIMNDDGTMARRDDLIKFGEKFDLKVGTIEDLIDFRSSKESTVEKILTKKIDTEFGEFELNVWEFENFTQ